MILAAALTLLVTPSVGARYEYRVESRIEAPSINSHVLFGMNMIERCVERHSDKIVWRQHFYGVSHEGTGVLNEVGASMADLEKLTMDVVTTRRNEMLRMRIGTVTMPLRGSAQVVLPPANSEVGAEWIAPITSNGRDWMIRYRLAGTTEAFGRPAARITGTAEPDQQLRSLVPYEFVVDAASGRVLHGTGAAESTGGGIRIRLAFRMWQVGVATAPPMPSLEPTVNG